MSRGRSSSGAGRRPPGRSGASRGAAGRGRPLRRRGRVVPEGERVLKTLDRLLSRAGICSRTDAGELLRSGRVRVDGKVATDPEQWIDVGASRVSLDGQPLRRAKPIVLLLSKPKGVVTSTTDKLGRPTIHDFLPKDRGHLFPVGRLDVDTSGLLLVTNDAQLAERLTNPEFHVPKTYLVKASGRLSDEQLDRLREGVVLADGPTRPAAVTRLREPGGRTVFELTITEGRNRQVRRMVEAVGSRVLKLVRVAVGPLPLGTLHPGQVRELERGEVEALRHASRARRALRRRR